MLCVSLHALDFFLLEVVMNSFHTVKSAVGHEAKVFSLL